LTPTTKEAPVNGFGIDRRKTRHLTACKVFRPATLAARSHDASTNELHTDLEALSSVVVEETLGVTGKVEFGGSVNGGEMPRGGV